MDYPFTTEEKNYLWSQFRCVRPSQKSLDRMSRQLDIPAATIGAWFNAHIDVALLEESIADKQAAIARATVAIDAANVAIGVAEAIVAAPSKQRGKMKIPTTGDYKAALDKRNARKAAKKRDNAYAASLLIPTKPHGARSTRIGLLAPAMPMDEMYGVANDDAAMLSDEEADGDDDMWFGPRGESPEVSDEVAVGLLTQLSRNNGGMSKMEKLYIEEQRRRRLEVLRNQARREKELEEMDEEEEEKKWVAMWKVCEKSKAMTEDSIMDPYIFRVLDGKEAPLPSSLEEHLKQLEWSPWTHPQ